MIWKFRIIFFIVFGFFSCNKIKYYPDNEIKNVTTKFLVHAAGGYGPYQENTLKAAKFGLSKLNGIEVDIQISKDKTIWLSHSAVLSSCGNFQSKCFAESRNDEIYQLDTCLGANYNFSKLEDVFKFMSEEYPDKFISLDVKEWVPCAASSVNVFDVMNVIADEIARLTKIYNREGYVLVESEISTFLSYVKQYCPGTETYLTTLGDFEKGMLLAIEAGYSGLSFKYNFDEIITADHVNLLHKKGLKIQLWTINTFELLQQAQTLNPDFIQTDDFDSEYFRIRSKRQGKWNTDDTDISDIHR